MYLPPTFNALLKLLKNVMIIASSFKDGGYIASKVPLSRMTSKVFGSNGNDSLNREKH